MASTVIIRPESPADVPAIAAVTRAAFRDAPHSSQTEHLIVDALRTSGSLAISLVAQSLAAQSLAAQSVASQLTATQSPPSPPLAEPPTGEIVGHIAFSPVTIDGQSIEWFGLGPLSVAPPRQRQGIGSLLVQAGLRELRQRHAAGCVVLGDPHYYRRFGFRPLEGLKLPGVPEEYFLALPLTDPARDAVDDHKFPRGRVAYHPAFEIPPHSESLPIR